MTDKNVSRRQILKSVAGTAGAAGLSGAASAAENSRLTQEALLDGYIVRPLLPVRLPTSMAFGPGDGDSQDLYVASSPRSGYEDQVLPPGIADAVTGLVSGGGTVERLHLTFTPAGPVATQTTTVVEGLEFPIGVGFDNDGTLYVSDNRRPIDVDGVSRQKATHFYVEALDGSGEKAPIVDGLPSGPIHDANDIELGPDGKLYLAVGSTSCNGVNYDREIPPYTGSILRVDPDELKDDPARLYWADEDGNAIENDAAEWDNVNRQIALHPRNEAFNEKVEVVARGFRNIYGLAFNEGVLHTGRNGAQNPATQDTFYRLDEIGQADVPDGNDELRPDEFSGIPHYGFPYMMNFAEGMGEGDGRNIEGVELKTNPRYEDANVEFSADDYIAADATMGWHVCATGLDFPNEGDFAFPESVQSDAYIAECGAYSLQDAVDGTVRAGDTRNTGRKVTRVDINDEGEIKGYQDWLTGFRSPTDVTFGPEGAMYIADIDAGLYVAYPSVDS